MIIKKTAPNDRTISNKKAPILPRTLIFNFKKFTTEYARYIATITSNKIKIFLKKSIRYLVIY
ncbi:MAG: hypothetical protein ABI358_12090 [Ginsengibacter sp.]